jgi:hypothetical protein
MELYFLYEYLHKMNQKYVETLVVKSVKIEVTSSSEEAKG